MRGRGEEAAVSFGPTPAPPDVAPPLRCRNSPPGALSHWGVTAAPGWGGGLTPSLLLPGMGVSREVGEREVGLHMGSHQGDALGSLQPPTHRPRLCSAAPQGAPGPAPLALSSQPFIPPAPKPAGSPAPDG